MVSPALFGLANFVAIATKVVEVNNPSNHGKISVPPPRRLGHHSHSKHRQPRLPRELGSRWVGFLDESVRLSDLDMDKH
uniref:Uncharacterized protein n=1 Tax=Oryza punctata TaxID=4537 RepID=A0A0E0JZG2_ORYPU